VPTELQSDPALSPDDGADVLIPDPQVCKRYSVTAMTLWRWDHNPTLGFPPPVRINRRKYRSNKRLRQWDRSLAAKS